MNKSIIAKCQNLGGQIENSHFSWKTTTFQRKLFISSSYQTRKKKKDAPAIADRYHYSCNNNCRSPHYLEAIAWHSLALQLQFN
jgi:hypothetical protein